MLNNEELARLIRHEIIGFREEDLPIGRSIPAMTPEMKTLWAMRRIIYLQTECLKEEIIFDLIEVDEPTPNRFFESGQGIYGTIMCRIGNLHFLLKDTREALGDLSTDPNIILMNDFGGSLGYFMIQKYSATVLAAQIYLARQGLLEEKDMLILGSSDGPQAMAGIKLGARRALCIDISTEEGRYMRLHAAQNNLQDRIDFMQADVTKPRQLIRRLPHSFGVLVSNLGNHYPGTEEGTIAIASHLAEQQKLVFVLGGYVHNADLEHMHLSSWTILRKLKAAGFEVKADVSYGKEGVISYILEN